jgi:hypothetical protein
VGIGNATTTGCSPYNRYWSSGTTDAFQAILPAVATLVHYYRLQTGHNGVLASSYGITIRTIHIDSCSSTAEATFWESVDLFTISTDSAFVCWRGQQVSAPSQSLVAIITDVVTEDNLKKDPPYLLPLE